MPRKKKEITALTALEASTLLHAAAYMDDEFFGAYLFSLLKEDELKLYKETYSSAKKKLKLIIKNANNEGNIKRD